MVDIGNEMFIISGEQRRFVLFAKHGDHAAIVQTRASSKSN